MEQGVKRPKFVPEFADVPKKRVGMPELPLDARKLNFSEVELGFTEELARQEAARCLSCRRCIGCGLCLAECQPCAIVYDEKPREISLRADAVIFAPEACQFDATRKRSLGYGECMNVVTSYELERLLSPTGPFGGLVLRPSDGEVPKRIGFVQCVGSRDEAIGANYCSCDCCSRTISQALRAREAIRGAEVHIFHRGLRPTGKTSELQLRSIEGQPWVSLTESGVTSVKEDPESGAVTVVYSAGGSEAEAVFDLVVLAVGIQARRDLRRLAKAGGASVNKYGFADPGVVGTIISKDGAAFSGTVRGPESAERSVIDALAGASRALGPWMPSVSGVTQPSSEPTGGSNRPVVFACEYGMALAAKAVPPAEKLEAAGLSLAGSCALLCHLDGRQKMAEALGGAKGLVILGCHPGSHEMMFERVLDLPSGAVKIVDRTVLAGDVAGAVVAAIKEIEERKPGSARVGGAGRSEPAGRADQTGRAGNDSPESLERAVAVVGGGVAGLAAASELLRRNIRTIIVNDSEALGAGFKWLSAGQAEDRAAVEGFVKAIEGHPAVRILKPAGISSVGRADGAFDLSVSAPGGEEHLAVDALIIATGTRSCVPTDYPSGTDLVATQDDLAAGLAAGRAHWNRIVMLQCVGSRDAGHPYCSRFCCRQALANAKRLKQADPGTDVTILHKGIRVFGFDEDLLEEAAELGVRLIEIKDKPVVEAGRPLRIRGVSAVGQAFSLECDALVLSVGHAADEVVRNLAGMTGARLDELGFFETSNALIEPFATTAPGVFVCGFARAPVTIEEAFWDGLGVAGAVCGYLKT